MRFGRSVTSKQPNGSYLTTWSPGTALGANSSPEFTISFATPDWKLGRRLFVHHGSYWTFVERAWVNGLAILALQNRLSTNSIFTHRMMWFFYTRSHSTRESLGRQFLSIRDLKGDYDRSARQQSYILPSIQCNNADKIGTKDDVRTILRAGETVSRESGLQARSFREQLYFGLYAAARLDPLRIEDQTQVDTLIRISLFDPGRRQNPTNEEKSILDSRFLKAFDRHCDDENEPFLRWFSGPNNSLVGLLAGSTQASSPAFERELVRQYFAERAWGAHRFVAQCIEAQMQSFIRSVDPPLTFDEQQRVVQYYCPKACWANLSLLLLQQRLDVIRPALLFHLGLSPESEWVPIAHRLLSYYVEMSDKRREVDRERKQLRGTQLDPNLADPLSEEDSRRFRRSRRS